MHEHGVSAAVRPLPRAGHSLDTSGLMLGPESPELSYMRERVQHIQPFDSRLQAPAASAQRQALAAASVFRLETRRLRT